MDYLTLDDQSLQDHHICCAMSDKKCAQGYAAKKDWLRTQFSNGYRFHKADVRGKVFIEYVPIEHSWLPLSGRKFMVINCFWVSGRFKGQGHGTALLDQCLRDADRLDGVVAVSSDKKRPFMTDPKFLAHKGFEVIDEAPPFFKLWGLKTNPSATFPTFLDPGRGWHNGVLLEHVPVHRVLHQHGTAGVWRLKGSAGHGAQDHQPGSGPRHAHPMDHQQRLPAWRVGDAGDESSKASRQAHRLTGRCEICN